MKELLIRITLVLAIIALVIFIFYVWRKIKRLEKGTSVFTPHSKSVDSSSCETPRPKFHFNSLIDADTSKSVQTEFYKESAEYALKIVKGETPICNDNLCENSRQVLQALQCMSEGERANIYISIQYMLISSNDLEEKMREISYQKQIPMWILFIKEAILKLVVNQDLSASPLSVSYCKSA